MLNNMFLLGEMSNKTMLTVLMVVLIVFLVLLTSLALVFIIALRKRAPVVKVIMAPPAEGAAASVPAPTENAEESVPAEAAAPAAAAKAEPEAEPEELDDDDDTEEGAAFVTEGSERVRYDRSVTAKIMQLPDESKEWYSQIKNELLSYGRVKDRMSWKRETFRIGRMALARIIVRGKTLCLLLAVDPTGFAGTKFKVEDVGHVASMADTPCQYRIKSVRRAKYAKEMLAAVMTELGMKKSADYEAQDFFMPYAGTMALMQQGLVKRVVSGSTRTFEIREVDKAEAEAAATATENKENK